MRDPQIGINWNLKQILWNVELAKMWNFLRYHILTCVRVGVIHFFSLTITLNLTLTVTLACRITSFVTWPHDGKNELDKIISNLFKNTVFTHIKPVV